MKKFFIILLTSLSLPLAVFSQNLGINHPNPQHPLSFSNTLGNKISLWGDAGPHYGFGIQSYLLQVHTDASFADIAFGYGSSTAFSETMRIKGNGFVGIGTSSPNAPLGFPAWLGKKITLYPGTIGDAGFAVWGNELRIASDYSGADITLGTDDRANGFTERMRIKGNGNVGIGTNNPLAKLHVTDNSVLFSAPGDALTTPGDVPAVGTGRRMFWYADKAAFRVGYFSNIGLWDKNQIGYCSFAAGRNAHASGESAVAIGGGPIATGNSAVALGSGARAGGWASISMGAMAVAAGNYSTAIGPTARADGYGAVALGFEAKAIGTSSTASGEFSRASGENSVALGRHADAIGKMSIAIGPYTTAKAVASCTVGESNDDADNPIPTVTNPLDRIFQIGNGTYGYPRSNAMTVLRNGNIGIGTTNPHTMLHIGNAGVLKINDGTGARYAQLFHSTNGNVHLDAFGGGGTYINWYSGAGVYVGNGAFGFGQVTASAFTVASSRLFKKDIVNTHYGLAEVLQLQGMEYLYINDSSNRKEIGLIAEDVEWVVPEVVYHNPSDKKVMGIDYGKLVPVLIEAIKEQQKQIVALSTNDKEMQTQIDELKKLVEKLITK